MRLIVTIFFAMLTINCRAQQAKTADTLPAPRNTALQFSGVAVLSRIGFAPIPSFAFNNPIAMLFLSISKARFSYEPAINLGLNGKPWFIDNWVKYRFISNGRLRLTAAVDPNLIFQNETLTGKQPILQGCRQVITALFGDCTVSKNLALKFTYWYCKGIDSGMLTGHFVDITGVVSNIKPSKNLFITLKPELFYFKNDGRVDGLFTSLSIIAGHNKFPLSLYVQGVQRLWADFTAAAFNWNIGVTYVF